MSTSLQIIHNYIPRMYQLVCKRAQKTENESSGNHNVGWCHPAHCIIHTTVIKDQLKKEHYWKAL